MFAVEDIEDVLERLRAHGAELVGELAEYEHKYRLCYVRGPEGIIIAVGRSRLADPFDLLLFSIQDGHVGRCRARSLKDVRLRRYKTASR